ncbi:putative ubiquitin carboxyl-terminal hydrolase 50, partial [Eschrichtius robustus]|nr:putative ubiquitin carboxyl-terminal hydrolase 50 [Eschrichtius robustus]
RALTPALQGEVREGTLWSPYEGLKQLGEAAVPQIPFLGDCSEVATAFAYVMTDMWLGDSDCVSPEIFWSALGKLYPAFMKKTQQDAQEFLIYVLNELHETLKKYHRRRAYEKRSIPRFCRKMIANESSIITRLFEGQLNYSIICLKCENCTYKNEVFTVLSLPIPSKYECSLQ